MGIMSIDNPTLAHFRHFSHFRHSFNYNIFPATQIMQNKPNFRNDKMNITIDITRNYKILSSSPGPKNKANSNPIQSQFKPKQTQFKANKAKNKPNSNPIAQYRHLMEMLKKVDN